MATETELEAAVQELWLRQDVVWHATRLRSDPEDEQNAWPRRIEIHIKFYRALLGAGLREGVAVDLVSHGRSGRAVPRYVINRAFIEWDVEAEMTSQDGVWRAFAILALIPVKDRWRLWCWICNSTVEEDYAESVFGWWEPQSFAYAKGTPISPERITALD